MATDFLRFCRAGSVNWMAFVGGVSGVGCVVVRIYTGFGEGASGSGLFVAWALDFWGFFYFFLSTTLLNQHWGGFFFLMFTLLLHCGVNQALFF